MGAENSRLIDDDEPPQTLRERSLSAVANLIKDGKARRIVVLTGAGISTAAGIPDFRSPGTGLYNNLARLNLPHAEAVFEIDYFRSYPQPFYILAKELYPGNFSPTISHVFIALLAKKNLLRMLFTQNIDCLERAAGVPSNRIVEAHGSFATQRCIDCKKPYPDKEMREHVESGEPPRCECGGLVKPDIVFFGENLPEVFYENRNQAATADLMLILGTSLSVHPFGALPSMAMEGVPRMLFNKERVGDLGTRADDVLCLGGCDDSVRKLAGELGWLDELEKMWRDIVGDEEANRQLDRAQIVEDVDEEESDDPDHPSHHWRDIVGANPKPLSKGELEMKEDLHRLVSEIGAKLVLSERPSDLGNDKANGKQVGERHTDTDTAASTPQISATATPDGEGQDTVVEKLETGSPTKAEQDDRRDDIPQTDALTHSADTASDGRRDGDGLVGTPVGTDPSETTAPGGHSAGSAKTADAD